MIKGHSGGFCVGSHPRNVGLRFRVQLKKSAGLGGRGGNFCETDDKIVLVRFCVPYN
jgi:hypothetical protein